MLTAAPFFTPTDSELAEWVDEGVNGWRHATGVRLVLTQMNQYLAGFSVYRPTPNGEQEVISGANFMDMFRLAQATAAVTRAQYPRWWNGKERPIGPKP